MGKSVAELKFNFGPMGCGKTIDLLRAAYSYEEKGLEVAIMKPAVDTKANQNIQSRIDGFERSVNYLICPGCNILEVIRRKFSKVSCVIIDEAQFLSAEQIDQLRAVTLRLGIPVTCYGLRTDRFGELFPGSTRLLAIADRLVEMDTICECGSKATMTGCFVDGKFTTKGANGAGQVLIDGATEARYVALCPRCHADYTNGVYGKEVL